jgi:hypothetical protein
MAVGVGLLRHRAAISWFISQMWAAADSRMLGRRRRRLEADAQFIRTEGWRRLSSCPQ